MAQLAERRDPEAIHALASANRQIQIADRLAEHRLFFGRKIRLVAILFEFVLLTLLERLPDAKPLLRHDDLDFIERRFAEVLAGEQLRFVDASQVAERTQVHALQAVSASHRKFEIADRDFHDLTVRDADLFIVGAVELRQRRFRVLVEQPRTFVERVGFREPFVAIGGFVVLVVVFVKYAEVVECALRNRRVFQALFVVPDRFVVVAREVVQEPEAEQRTGVRRVEFDGSLEALGGANHVAFGFADATFLEVEFRVVRGHILDLRQDRLRFGDVALVPQDTRSLQLNLLGRVAGFFRFLERLQRLIVFLPRRMGTTEEERRERAFGLFQMIDGRVHVAEVKMHDAELQVQLFLLRTGRGGESFLQYVVDVAQAANLGGALGESFAELRDHAPFKFFPFHEQRA